MRAVFTITMKENPGSWHATGVEGLGIWIDFHDLQHRSGTPQVIY
jgi:hypothetical protein